MRRLIINADDLGLTPGVNRAIFNAHREGVVTSATLMANGAALKDAVDQLPCNSKLSVGCHLSLVDGKPLSPPEQIPTLLGDRGEFRQSIAHLGVAARRAHLSRAEIEHEAAMQFRALQLLGVNLSHFDAHKHAHMFPEILQPALNAAKACGIRAVRNPFESLLALPFSTFLRNPKLLKRLFQVSVLRTMRSKWKKMVQQAGLSTPDGSLGVIITGDMNETLLCAILTHMPQGTWELVCHPGYDDADLAKIRTRLRDSRVQEFELLTSPGTKRLIGRLGIELISYREL